MKRLLCFGLLLMLGTLVFGQAANIPTCNGTNGPNCTDYFGVANWANSPLPAGSIAGFTVMLGGSGYTAPTVTITDPTGTLATVASVAVDPVSGAITGITVGNGGSGYIAPLVTITDPSPSAGGAMVSATIGPPFTGGMPKFQDTLPSFSALPTLAGGLVAATPDTTTFPNSDFYVIGLTQYAQQLHSSLPPTTLRGYCQLPSASSTTCSAGPSYLGPVIVASKGRPVRVLFKNMLPSSTSGGNLFIPVDTTYMGADKAAAGTTNTQNRATLHLHGGNTPWISDGTTMQWTAPETESAITTSTQRGESVQFVPDMWFDTNGNLLASCAGQSTCSVTGATNDPGPGHLTFFWTNQQGGRLMFYHDHAYGITRLNVYAGEAAGYLLLDPVEEDKLAAATVPGTVGATTPADLTHLIPLVIQDKTFVPGPKQLAAEDPTWVGNFGATPLDTTNGLPNGDLWFPHVYMPNQNPADPGGGNAFGRWDYGAWFFPPMTSLTAANPSTAVTIPCTSAAFPGVLLAPAPANNNLEGCPITPNPSGTPEGFMDTPLVNGKAYPVMHLAPAAYRFQILSAGNDRSWNLQLYVADATQNNTEVAMVPAAPPAAGATLPLCSQINPITNTSLGIGLARAILDASGNPLNGTGLPANCWPNYGSIAGIPAKQTMWAADGRAGGAPDPRTAGPPFIQIGTEGGLLPAPVVIPSTPTGYEWNPRSITITNVGVHGLWLGPAERADVIVDFSQFAGKTLILYSDAPTPAPAFDSRNDYFTGDGDQTSIGGAPNTPPGYGPNTRTVMQIVVDGNAANTVPFSLSALRGAFNSTATTPGLFASTQPTTIVPEAAYGPAYNTTFPNTFAKISDNTITFTPIAPLTFEALLGPPGTGTCSATLPNQQCAVMDQKAIQELFTLDYGRMNATLGTELPFTNFLTQTTIPLGYVDPATEIIKDGDTQIWKISHNGVDTHFIHFHLVNVQVLNRVGWDGSLRPIEENELGWKDTVRMNPLEDIFVAMQATKQILPWPIPNSVRLMDVTAPADATGQQFTNVDPFTNLGAPTTNAVQNFGWEYVWHCHILGHEENDMMRPIVFQVPPPAPSNLVAAPNLSVPGQVNLSWTDNSASETGFTVQRDDTGANFVQGDTITTIATVGPSTPTNAAGEGTSWGGPITTTDTPPNTGTFYYRVRAEDNGFTGVLEQSYNATGPLLSGWSNTAPLTTTPINPTVSFTGAPPTAAYNTSFTVIATTNANVMPTITSTGVCTVGAVSGTPTSASAMVTMTSGTGSCLLTANWAAAAFFNPATASQTTVAALATPTVSFTGAPASAAFGATFTVTATTNASSTASMAAAGACTVGGVTGTPASAKATVTMTSGTGTCTLTANWTADANYAAAGPLTQSTLATKIAPTVTFTSAPGSAVYNTTFNVATTTNSTSVAVITASGACSIVGNIVTMTSGTGTCSLTANWAADANYLAATATQSTAAAKAASATTIGAHTPNPSVVGQAVPVSFSVTGTTVPTGNVTVTATTGESCTGTVAAGSCSLTFLTTGTRTMTATYGGDANFLGSASTASTSQNVIDFVLGISPGAQTVNGGQKATYRLTATAIGGVAMPLSLSCTTNQPNYTCTVSPTSVTPNGGTKSATVTVNTVRGFRGTWTVTVRGVDIQTGFTLTHTVTAGLTVTR